MNKIVIRQDFKGSLDIQYDGNFNENLISAVQLTTNRWKGIVPFQKFLSYEHIRDIESENGMVFLEKTRKIALEKGGIQMIKAMKYDILELWDKDEFEIKMVSELITGNKIETEEV